MGVLPMSGAGLGVNPRQHRQHWAFYDCGSAAEEGERKVRYGGTLEQWCKIHFPNSNANPVTWEHNLYIDDELLTDLAIPESVTEVNSCSFYNCTSLTSAVFHDGVTTIGSNAFNGCSNLASVMFGSGLKTIDSSAFSDCTGLTEVTIPDGVTELGWWAFDGCTSLQSVVIGDGVELIDHYAFRDCTSLTDVTFGERVREIGGNAFSGCTGFKTLEVNVETIGMSAFQDCTGLVELILGEGVKSIEAFAFENCTALQDVYCYATTKPSLSLGINPFEDLPDDATLHVPCASLDSYEYWGSFDYVVGIMPVLTVKANDPSMGEVTIEQEADCDLPAIIKATAYEGYTFVKWDDGNTANPRTVDVTEDMTLTAEFAPKGTGINSAEQQLVVTSGQGCIRVQGASGMVVSVYNTQGLRLYQGVTEEVTTITVPSAGLYVVAVGEDLVKVIVK